ncbi:MAG: iron chelate uptake ABC transporter family permease subunit [Phycisphaerae bacterium]|jgi:ABC-type Mn2+/Zn2+ transport system permease subunit/Mn-dependent DtxR family transcriptional regulator
MDINLAILASGESISVYERLMMPFVYYWQPLLGSVLIGGVLGVLGCFVVLRRMALIGDAISHAVLPGVVVAFLLVSTGITGLFIGALLAGIMTAVGINVVARFSRVKEDAAVGIVFTAMFALGVILISWLPAGTHFDLKCFLFGDPLAVERADLISIIVIVPVVLGAIFLLFRPLKLMSFDPTMASTMGLNVTVLHYMLMILLSATVVAALRSVGVIMAVAMLITPAAVGYQLTNRLQTMIIVAASAGGLSALVGMFLAFQVDCPPGPAMVLVATAMFAVAMIFAPERGVLAERQRRRRVRDHIVEEDVLKALVRRFARMEAPTVELARMLAPTPAGGVNRAMRSLEKEGFLTRTHNRCALTDSGRERAVGLVRAHRLWETYLAEHNIGDPDLHHMAERLEHAHELAKELDVVLGHPKLDPHGEPIPREGDASVDA